MADTVEARIRAELARRQLPESSLCAVLGLSKTAVSRRLQGHTDWGLRQVVAVAGFLGVDPRDLIPGLPAAA